MNTYIKSEQYVDLGLAALQKYTRLPAYFQKMSGDAFGNAQNDTLYFKSNRVTTARDYEWRSRTAPIILDKIGQTRTAITLDTHLYQGVQVTNEELALDIRDFANDIVSPQVQALVDRADQKTVIGLRAADFKTALPAIYLDDDPYVVGVAIRKLLNAQGAPNERRAFLVGADVEEWLLTSDRLAPPSQGTQPSIIQNLMIGRIANFDIIPSPFLSATEIFAVTPQTIVIANSAPRLPLGAAQKARRNAGGWSLLHTLDYDTMYQRDMSVLSTFMGVNSIEDELLTKVDVNGFTVLDLDAEGNPQPTGKNVRGAKGTLTLTARPS